MDPKARYRQAMEALYLVCIVVSAAALVIITLIIPLGVFMRYVMNSPLSWPEPAAILMMVLFSFVGAGAVYRANGHIAVEALLNALGPGARRRLGVAVDACMIATGVFMVVYGGYLCQELWHQSIAEFPGLPVGLTYMPIPVGGAITLAFILEKIWLGPPPATSVMYRDQPTAVE
jgi:TRAP-type C4-dicarboxylate transport system permease small subunit